MKIEFERDHVPGFIRLAGMEIELGEVLGRKVDLRTPEELSRYFRQEALNSAQDIISSTVAQSILAGSNDPENLSQAVDDAIHEGIGQAFNSMANS